MFVWSIMKKPYDGPFVLEVAERPAWVSIANELVELACESGGHLFCSGGPDWLWDVPTPGSKPSTETEGIDKSLGERFFHAYQRFGQFVDSKTTATEVILSYEDAKAVSPEFVREMEELESDLESD